MKKGSLNKFFNSYANRGMGLENDINISNKYYLENDIAVIHKKPTPIKVTKIIYNKSGSIISEGFFEKPSTTDYNGIYKGKYIDFDAKETNSKTSFSLNNIHKHQIEHLFNILKHGGLSFLIVRFNMLNKTYIVFSGKLKQFVENEKRKSIPLIFFEKNGIIIKDKINPRLDYLEILDKYFPEVENHDEKKK